MGTGIPGNDAGTEIKTWEDVKMKKDLERFFKDTQGVGWGFVKSGRRRWWNPLRYILGKRYLKHIPINKIRR